MARDGEVILDDLFENAIAINLIPSKFKRGRIGMLFAVLAAEFVGWEQVLDNYDSESHIQTAKIPDNIIKLSEPLHYKTPALPSDVMVRIFWDRDFTDRTNVVLPFGQIAQSADSDPIQYAITERVVLYDDAEAVWVRARSIEKGAGTMIPPNYLTTLSPSITGVKVINPEESWGGSDAESADVVRTRALGARYAYEKGTSSSIDLELSKIGVLSYQYNLVDNMYGYGTMALFIDTNSDEYIEEIEAKIKEIKASGIYATIEKAKIIPFIFNFGVKVVSEHDITPEERDNLKKDLIKETIEYVTFNGVGKKIIISHLIHHLLDKLLDKYNFFDLHIDTSTYSNRRDNNGNIILEVNEKLEITDVVIETLTG